MNKKFKNYAAVETVQTDDNWKHLSKNERIGLIEDYLSNYQGAENFKVMQADANGQVVIAIEENIPADTRGLYLLDLEQSLKDNIDSGIHLWCEPVGDKSRLRKLRGVVINTEMTDGGIEL